MQKWSRWKRGLGVLIAALLSLALYDGIAQAQSSSTNFQMVEMEIGGTSAEQSCSEQYCSHVSIGEIGQTSQLSSPAFGPINAVEPILEVIIEPGNSNLGILSTQTTATTTSIVRIRNNLAGGGYVMSLLGDAPTFRNHTLRTTSTPSVSTPGTEQFGINVVANSSPSVGTDPVQVPAGTDVFGVADDLYKISNLFKYESGEVIARGITETGRTDYTISMIINISSGTPAGHYTSDFKVLVVPTY